MVYHYNDILLHDVILRLPQGRMRGNLSTFIDIKYIVPTGLDFVLRYDYKYTVLNGTFNSFRLI